MFANVFNFISTSILILFFYDTITSVFTPLSQWFWLLAKVFKMIDEPRQFPHSVHRLAREAVGPGHGPGAAAKHAHFAHLKWQQIYCSDFVTGNLHSYVFSGRILERLTYLADQSGCWPLNLWRDFSLKAFGSDSRKCTEIFIHV